MSHGCCFMFYNFFFSENINQDLFEIDQGELASMLAGESFHAPDLNFLDEEEKEARNEYRFMDASYSTGGQHDFTTFSGIHGTAEITVRYVLVFLLEKVKILHPSWVFFFLCDKLVTFQLLLWLNSQI